MAGKKTEAQRRGTSRLVILDAHAILHRAYHAIPDFSTSKGEPTGALYGLVSTLLKAMDDLKPDYIVAARDLPGKTNRHELFEAYKATRVKAEPELVEQLSRAPSVFEAFGIPLYEAPGYEADDVIGTIVKKLGSRKDISIIIVTGDLDTLQLVSDNVKVYTMRKGIADTLLYDVETVRERYGFGPECIVDLKGIRGDPSDNIKGVAGVGEESAVKLIRAFGGIEAIAKAIHAEGVEQIAERTGVRARYVELLKNHLDEAMFSKSLATIHTDTPIHFGLPAARWHLADYASAIIALCERFEFRSLKERIRAAAGEKKEEPRSPADVDPRVLKETAIALWLLHSDMTNPSFEDILRYVGDDDFERAREAIFSELHKTGRLNDVYEHIERPLIPVIERMNGTGILVDVAYLRQLSREYEKELGDIAGRIYKHAGREFNVNSPKQLATVLFDELKIAPPRLKKTATGARTTREEELAKLKDLHPIVGDILAYRELQKLLSTYIEKLPTLIAKDGRLHTEFLQAGTTTGRMASQNPNLQNIPVKSEYGRRIREAFVADRGYVLAAIDYSQIELRVAAGLAGDQKLIGIFKKGIDVHTAVAAEVFNVPPEHVDYEMRRRAKVINFGILYGMGVNALRAALARHTDSVNGLGENLPTGRQDVSREEAAEYLAEYFAKYSGLARFIEQTKADATRLGYTETLFGRRRYFPALKSALPNLKAAAERMAINAPIQGTQSDIIKLAMVEADKLIEKKEWRDKARLLLQVHDELVYEVRNGDAEAIAHALRDVMESVVPAEKLNGVPIRAEISIGKNWGDVKRMPKV